MAEQEDFTKINFMSFEYMMQEILAKLTLSNEDRESYTKDADEIRDYIIDRMKKIDKDFAKCFNGTSLTGSYLDHIKIEHPDEFDINIKLKLPYSIQIVEDKKYPGYLFLQAVNETRSSKLTDPYTDGVFYVSPVRLQNWIRHIISSIFKGNALIFPRSKSGRIYSVTYRGNTVAHTFIATDQNNKKRKISFDFVPSFEFTNKDWIPSRKYVAPKMPWFAVPAPMYPYTKKNHFIFKISAPHQERELLKYKNNLKNALRLLKAIKDHNNMPKLASYFLKTLFLWETEKQSDQFWDQPMGYLLLHMLRRLVQYLHDGCLPFFWNIDLNLLDRMSSDDKNSYAQNFNKIFMKLENYNKNEPIEDFAKIFGVQIFSVEMLEKRSNDTLCAIL